MNTTTKTSVGLLIPAVSTIAFFVVIFNQSFLSALFVAVGGLLIWFAYSSIVRAKMPDITGNIVMLYGIMLSLAFFLNYGFDVNMFGGYEIQVEGAVGAVVVLFFTVLLGSLYNNRPELTSTKSDQVIYQKEATPKEPVEPTSDSEQDGYSYDEDDFEDFDFSDYEDAYDDMEDHYSEYEYDGEYED